MLFVLAVSYNGFIHSMFLYWALNILLQSISSHLYYSVDAIMLLVKNDFLARTNFADI